ncbi:MAG: peptide/nickel transport system substrate-binding protein [Thermodesulfobacteriota bacterium]|nr:peptide/nickel transport system substrate-binding protein [Thermodesulfobacteriota bacterium]
MRINKNLFVIIMIILGFLAGCSDKPSQTINPAESTETKGPTPVPAAESKPAYGDMIIIGSIGDASVLLPVLASDSASGDINGLIYNGLVRYDRDINLIGELAEKWEISEDKLTIRFFLKKDVKWHDGKPFTSKDVEYTYKVYVDPKTPTAYSTDFLRVKEFRVLDDYTLEVVYEKPYAPALGSWGQGMLPRHLLEGVDITESPLKRNPVGTGPYRFKDWTTGEKIILDSFHEYFDGRPYIDRVMTRIIPDLATMFLELKALSLDQMGLTPLQYVRQTDTKWFKDNFNKYKYLGFGYSYLGYNLQDWKFKDQRVRQALTTAINRESIVQGVLLGLGTVTNTPYKPDSFWYNQNVTKFPYDPDKAKEMLAEAGWKDTDGDGILDKDGKPFEFTIITNHGNDIRKNAATIIQRDLKKVGIEVKIRVIEWAAFLKNFINKRNFEACLLGWGIGVDPNQIDIWNSKKTGENELNFINFQNPEVDRLLDLGASTYDKEERKKYYDKFQEIIAEEQPYTFLFVQYSLPTINSRFHGIEPAPIGIGYNFVKWYVPKALQKYTIQP